MENILGTTEQLTATLHLAKIGYRQFTAVVACKSSANGWLTSDVCGKRTTAQKNLEAKLLALGIPVPKWSVKDHGTVNRNPAPAPQQVINSAPAPEPEVDDEAPTLRRIDPSLEAEAAQIPERKAQYAQVVLPPVAPRMEGGYVTPLSDKAAWLDVYRQARAKFDSIQFEEGETRESQSEKVKAYRESINTLMESISFIGPWRRTVGGDFWIRFSGEQDHTTRGAIHRSRRQVQKNINGNYVVVENGKTRTVLGSNLSREEKRAANKAAYREQRKQERAAKGLSYNGNPEHRDVAYKYAAGMSKAAREAGHDSGTQRLWYKVGYVVSLRSQGALPHVKFEEDLKAAGISEEYLQGQVSEYKGEVRKAA